MHWFYTVHIDQSHWIGFLWYLSLHTHSSELRAVPGWGPLVARAEELAPAFLVALLAGVLATLVTSEPAAEAPRTTGAV